MSEAARIELDSQTEFQRRLNSVTDKNTPIYSSFDGEFTKGMWHSSLIEELKRRDDNDNECTYAINDERDILIYSYATWKSPAVRVKELHRDDTLICWTKNLATNRFVKSKFFSADTQIQEFDNVWMDIYYQAFMENKEGAREAHNLSTGNTPELTSFCLELAETPLEFDLPWYYSEHPALAYPLYHLHRNKARSYHTFKLKNKIWDLLRMCIKDKETGEWHTVPAGDYRDRLDYTMESIPHPKIWGRYGTLTQGEKECHAAASKSYVIRNVMSVDTDNRFTLGTTQTLNLASIAAPCLAIFWVVENKEATQNNCHSNYTTHDSVPERRYARNPVETSSLRYTKDPKGSSGVGAACFEDFSSEHFTSASFRRHLRSRPTEIGYHCYSFAQDLGGYLHGERGISLSAVGAELSCKFWKPRSRTGQRRPVVDSQRDLEASISDSVSATGSSSSEPIDQQSIDQLMKTEFILHTRVLILRELTFEHLSDKTVLKLV